MVRKLIRLHLLYAVLAAVAAIAIPVYYWLIVPEPQQLQNNSAFREAVAKISDPEHLKKVITQVIRDADSFLITAKKAVDAAILLLVVVLVASAAGFLQSYVRLRRLQQASDREKSGAL
jgi:hypothetical protein